MSTEKIAKFFDDQLNEISKVVDRGNFPVMKKTMEGLLHGEGYILSITMTKTSITANEQQPVSLDESRNRFTVGNDAVAQVRENGFTTNNKPVVSEKDQGWDSINALLEQDEFKTHHN